MSRKKIIPENLTQKHVESNFDVNDVSGYAFDSQGTISDNKMLSYSSLDHISENKAVEETVMFSANFLVDKGLEITKSHSESSSLDVKDLDSDSDFFSSPALCNFKKGNLSAKGNKRNLKWSGKNTPCSKFSLKKSDPANDLTSQNQKISGNPSSRCFITDSKLAIDNINSINNSNSNTNIPFLQSVKDVDAGTGNLNRNLRPRHHMDKLSEFFSKFIFNINYANKLQTFILLIFWRLFLFIMLLKYVTFSSLLFQKFCFIAKQRIDSGFFLFEAERKKKEEKKKNKKNVKKFCGVMG